MAYVAIASLIGQRFGRLTVLAQAPSDPERRGRRLLCGCECGEIASPRVTAVLSGDTRSCGCIKREQYPKPQKQIVGYGSAHVRVYKARGSASQFACVDCGQRARDWSYDNADPNELVDPRGCRYSVSPGHYQPRCPACHGAFDASVSKLAAACRNGHERTPENQSQDVHGRRLCLDCQRATRARAKAKRQAKR